MPYKDPQKQKDWYQKNKQRVLERVSQHYRDNRDEKKEYARNYFKINRERALASQANYRKYKKDAYRAAIDRWMETHKEEYREWKRGWQKEWAKNNRSRINATYAKRRANKKNSIDETTDFEAIKQFYLLAEKLSEDGVKYVVDHIQPLALGGKHHQDNLQVITWSENLSKGKKYPFKVKESFRPDFTWTTHV